MLVQFQLESAAKTIVDTALSASNALSWHVYKTDSMDVNTFPCVRIVAGQWKDMHPEVHSGVGIAELSIMTCAVKHDTTQQLFETITNSVVNEFLKDSASLSSGSLHVDAILDDGINVDTLTDGWIATQRLLVVCGIVTQN